MAATETPHVTDDLLGCPNNPLKICPRLVLLDEVSKGEVFEDPDYCNDGLRHSEQLAHFYRNNSGGTCQEQPADECTFVKNQPTRFGRLIDGILRSF